MPNVETLVSSFAMLMELATTQPDNLENVEIWEEEQQRMQVEEGDDPH